MTADLDKLLARLRELEAEDQRTHEAMLDTATPTEREFLNRPRSLRKRVFPAMIGCVEALNELAPLSLDAWNALKRDVPGLLGAALAAEAALAELQRAAEEQNHEAG